MGGLAGVVHFRGDRPDAHLTSRMSELLAHRGPDAEGHFTGGPATLTHRQRILKPGSPSQPLVFGDLVVMLDGWIYDHKEFSRRAREERSVESDVEALAAAWKRCGLRLLDFIDGDFAAAIWDRRAATLTLIRDKMGVRPLYWSRYGDRFAFASEVPALRTLPWVSNDLATETLSEFLSFRVVHAPRTLLRDVHQVEPGHWLQVNVDRLRTRRYWSPDYALPSAERPPESETIDALQEAVLRSVRRRLVPGQEVGLYLSGGLGSTAIAAAARDLYRPLVSFTMAFADDPHPESPFAGRVAKLLGLQHHTVVVGTRELAGTFDAAVAALGHPLGNPSVVLQLALARAVGAQVPVALSGDGGEELFGGRILDGLAKRLRRARAFSRLPGALQRIGRAVLEDSTTTPLEQYGLELGIGGSRVFDVTERQALLRDPKLVRPAVRHDVLAPFYANLETDPVNAVLHATLRSWLCEGSLTRADRTAARAGLELRFPLLDREVVSRAAALPGSFKIRRVGSSLHTRWPLRAMLGGVLPPPLVNRPKRGMPSPLDSWFAGPGRLFMESRFGRLKKNRHGLWRDAYLEELRQGVGKGHRGTGIRLWSLFLLDAWLSTL